MKPVSQTLAVTTAAGSSLGTWIPLSLFHSSFNVGYSVDINSPAVATAANILVIGTLQNILVDASVGADAIFTIKATAAAGFGGENTTSPIAAINFSIADCSSNIETTFRVIQQGT